MRIVLTGGCTGGHIYPALAIGDKFREEDPDCEIIYIACGEPLEREIIPAHGYRLYEVEATGLDRSDPVKFYNTVKRTMKGRDESLRILREFRPDAVISTGSFVSVPVVLAAKKLKVPVYIHEQNGYPGVSNKLAARFARNVFLGFESARRHFGSKNNIVYSGNPVRAEFCGRDRDADRDALGIFQNDLVIMVFGGSLGSATTNAIGEAVARKYADKEGYTVIWGTGNEYYDEISERLEEEGFAPDNVRISAYISDMPQTISASDIVISRSGALSTAETTMVGRAAIFIPSPNVTADHQYYNAKAVEDAGGALIIREGVDTADKVLDALADLDNNRDRIKAMAEASRSIAPVHATDIIYRTVCGIEPPSETEEEEGTDETGGVQQTPSLTEEELAQTLYGLPPEHEELGELKDRIAARRQEKDRKRKSFRTKFYVVTITLLVSIAAALLSLSPVFTVDSIEVRGNSHYTTEEIINMAHAVPGKNIIYNANKEEITSYLEQNPYIKSARVSRRLPSTLVIKVRERQEKFAFRYDDDYLIMDEDGILLKKTRNKPNQTMVEGNVVNRIKLGEPLGTEDERLFRETVDLIKATSKADLYFVRIDMSSRNKVRAYIYDTLLVRTDYDSLMTNLKNGRLHQIVEKLFDDGIRRGTITFNEDGSASFMPII
ncbi:MAG: undecaprenyldiphospho-muramoylpentapeptide beta-N-acetylglucosaminyltransferase [Mogibacterium sp.]|nr:undecaprenyldiphospho-muramoylpentapeptide beta-N-acetylglucosaminyltransferase [Mogibacterium sp.]